MTKLGRLGIIGSAALLTAVPVSLQSQNNVGSSLPSLGISHAAAQVFPGHYRRVARRSYRRAARYSAYVAGSTAGYYGNPYGYGYGGGFGGYSYGGYGGYAYPYSTSYYGGYSTSGVYRRAYRRAY